MLPRRRRGRPERYRSRTLRHPRRPAPTLEPGWPVPDFLAAIGLVLVVEGLVYGGFPGLAKKLATEVLGVPENVLRIAGLASIAVGVGVVWLVRG